MAGRNPSSEPAPWEAPGKRHTQQYGAGGVPQPPQPPRPMPQTAPAYPQPPAAAYPPPPGAPAYPQPPAGAYAPPGAPALAGGYAMPMAQHFEKPTSMLAVISLVCAGLALFTGITVLPGLILGLMALRETGPTGAKSGRGLAVAGAVINGAMLAIGLVLVMVIFVFAAAATSQFEGMVNVSVDGSLIVQRAEMYYRDKGDFAGGGHRFIGGYKNADKGKGPLMVTDLVGAHELKMPIDRYFLEVKGDTATVWYTDPKTGKQMAGSFSATRGQAGPGGRDDWLWD